MSLLYLGGFCLFSFIWCLKYVFQTKQHSEPKQIHSLHKNQNICIVLQNEADASDKCFKNFLAATWKIT